MSYLYLVTNTGFFYIPSSTIIASWNGNNWLPMGYPIINNYYPRGVGCEDVPNVTAFSTFNGNLFAGGYFDTIKLGYANAVAQFNGTSWDSVGEGVEGASKFSGGCYDVGCFAVFQGELYMGGIFQYTGDNKLVNYIVKWNGSSWTSVGSGMHGLGGVFCLTVYNGNLYAGGIFDTAGGIPANNIAMWNGTRWSAVGSGTNGEVATLCVYNGVLYAGGVFDSAGGHKANDITYWNGSTWSSLGSGIPWFNKYNVCVYAMTVYGSVLCVGGNFDTAGGMPANDIAYWNGSNWQSLGSGVNGVVFALTTYNNALIVGGYFDSAGGLAANNIAQWTSPLGISELTDKFEDIQVYPNPNNGIFTISLNHPELVSGSQILEMYNVFGQYIYTATLKQVQGNNTINLSSQPNGVYFYRVVSENGVLVGDGKIIIQR